VVLDLGGTSLQLTHVYEGEVTSTASVPLGVVRTAQRFLTTDPPTKQEMTALREDVLRHISPVLPLTQIRSW
jgi:exopolyphosphatase/pppGpp-phosphohydrolase